MVKSSRSNTFSYLQKMYEQISMSQRLSAKDPEYANYAGGSLEIANQIADIDLIKEQKLLPESLNFILDLQRARLIHRKKAFFATIGTKELSQLGFLLGVSEEDDLSAT